MMTTYEQLLFCYGAIVGCTICIIFQVIIATKRYKEKYKTTWLESIMNIW